MLSRDVSVGGATDILGAVIGSEEGDVTIDTGTLTHANLSDHNAYNDFGVSVTLNASMFMPPKTPEETARDVAQQNAACQAIGGCTSPNWSTQGHLAFDDGAQNTNATIGATEGTVTVSIRDETAQAALEDSDATAGVDEINTDLDTAQVVTRDEHERVDFYLSDSSIKGLGKITESIARVMVEAVERLGDELALAYYTLIEAGADRDRLDELVKSGNTQRLLEEVRYLETSRNGRSAANRAFIRRILARRGLVRSNETMRSLFREILEINPNYNPMYSPNSSISRTLNYLRRDLARLQATRPNWQLDGLQGNWRLFPESAPARARDYEQQVTGAALGWSYEIRAGGVSARFDGISRNGVGYIEAKGPGYASFVRSDGSFHPWWQGYRGMMQQFSRQNDISIATGRPVFVYTPKT